MRNIITGHAGGHLRDRFIELVEEGADSPLTAELSGLCGKLWNCIDVLPGFVCDELGLTAGSNYAKAARQLRRGCSVQ